MQQPVHQDITQKGHLSHFTALRFHEVEYIAIQSIFNSYVEPFDFHLAGVGLHSAYERSFERSVTTAVQLRSELGVHLKLSGFVEFCMILVQVKDMYRVLV